MCARDNRRLHLLGPSLAALALTLVPAACGDGEVSDLVDAANPGQGDTSETTEPPTTDTPTTGDAPTTETPTTETPTTESPTTEAPDSGGGDEGGGTDTDPVSDDDGTDTDQLLLIGGIVLVALLVLWVLYSLLAGRRRRRQAVDDRIEHLTSGARWVHDQSSIELISGAPSPERLQAAWMDTRRRTNDLASDASELAATAHGDDSTRLRRLAGALMGLQGALDTHVDLRLQQTGDPNASMALRESADAVNGRRYELEAAIDALTTRT
jgi:hypothetical protein